MGYGLQQSTFTVKGDGSPYILPTRGNYLFVRSTQQVCQYEVIQNALGGHDGAKTTLTLGKNAEVQFPYEYDQIVVTNNSGSDCVVSLFTGAGQYGITIPSFTGSADSWSVPHHASLDQGDELHVGPLEGTEGYKRVFVQADSNNSVSLWVSSISYSGENGADILEALELLPGATITLEIASGDVYITNALDSGSDAQTVRCGVEQYATG